MRSETKTNMDAQSAAINGRKKYANRKHSRVRTGPMLAAIAGASTLAYQASAIAASASWIRTAAGTYSWNDSTNWNNTFPNGATSNSATIATDLTGDETINLNQNIQVSAFPTFGDSTATAGAYNNFLIQGNGSFNLTIPATGITSQNGSNTISSAIVLNVATGTTISHNNAVDATGSLTLSGGITGTNAALTLGGSGGILVNSNVNIGTGVLTKSGANTVTLSGNNTLNNVSISAGTLKVTNAGALGAAGKTITMPTLAAGATLHYASDSAINTQNLFVIATSGSNTVLIDRETAGAAVNQSFSTMTMQGTGFGMNFNVGSNVTSGTPVVTISAIAGVVNNGTKTFSVGGGASLSVGTISVTNTLGVGGNAATTFTLQTTTIGNEVTGAITNGTGNTTSIKIDNGGTWRFSGTSNSYTGSNTITSGVLEAASLADGGSNSSIGASTNLAANLVFGSASATLRYIGIADATIDRSFTFSSGAGGGATIWAGSFAAQPPELGTASTAS